MNSIPVLRSKLIMPELSDSFLMTYRQKTLHNNMDSCRAVTICAPAGYGKTTLAISYFKYQTAASSKVCWYRSDPEDINLPIFASHLTHAIFQSDTIFPVDNASSAICSEAWIRHHQASDIRTYIVLDDFHNVAGNQNICDMIRYLLENLPPSFSIFLLSRGNISVFTEKQKLEKKILKIGLRELSFTNAEIEEIIRSIGRPPLDKKLSDIIARRAEGWIAGIILLFQSVKGKTPDDESVYINKLTHEDALFKYLSMEVLKSIEATTQDSLSKLALLQDFTAAEAQEILKIENAKSVMDQCIGFGMFIQRIPGDPVVYRFHSLFREFLLYILHGRYTEEHIDGLHLDAAKYYINHSVLMRAAEHISKCKDPNAALDIVINAGFNKFLIGERAQLKIWLDLLPDKIINLSPILLMYKAQLMPNNRQQEMVRPLQKAIKQSLADNNPEVYFNLSSVLIYILFCSNNMKGLLEMTSGTSHLLSSASEQMKNALGLLTMAKHIAEENYSMAEIQSENTKYALLPEDSQWLYLILSSIIYICLGKLTRAEESMRKAIVLYNFKNVEPAKGFILHYLTTALCLKNQINELPPYINEIVNIGNKYDYDFLSAGGRLFSAYEKYLSSDTETAIKMLDSAVFHYSQINNKAMATLAKMLRLLWSVRNGRVSAHFNEAQDSFNLLECLCPGLMITEITESILGAIARESREFHIAESCLLSAIKAAREKRAYQVLCGSLFHIAELYFSTNDTVQGHSYLKEAIEFSSCNRYFMFWDIHIPTLVEMASRSIRYGYCTHYAEELLCKFYSANTVSYLSEKIKSIDETQIKAFIDVFIAKYNNNGYENLYFVKATLFGKPQISINGMQIPDTDWNTKKVKGLLDYLLLNSGKTIPKELLAETLWPDSDSKSAIASQRTALYHLRKILTKYNVEVTGENAFIYETPGGLQIRNNDALVLDTYEFLALYAEFSLLKDSNVQHEQKQIEILKKMISLYKGDLMEYCDYGDLFVYERERLKSIFIEACDKLTSIYFKYGEFQKSEQILKHALVSEPYSENICLKLLKLYISQGRRNKAVKLYYSFKARLEKELDIKIDKRLSDMVRSSKPKAQKDGHQ